MQHYRSAIEIYIGVSDFSSPSERLFLSISEFDIMLIKHHSGHNKYNILSIISSYGAKPANCNVQWAMKMSRIPSYSWDVKISFFKAKISASQLSTLDLKSIPLTDVWKILIIFWYVKLQSSRKLIPCLDGLSKNFGNEILLIWSNKWNLFIKFFTHMSSKSRDKSNEPN